MEKLYFLLALVLLGLAVAVNSMPFEEVNDGALMEAETLDEFMVEEKRRGFKITCKYMKQ